MMEQKESSVLFSLQNLMSLEENRVREEQEAQQRRAREQAEARAEAERQFRAAEEQRAQKEQQRQRELEQQRAEEAARLAAIRDAELERTKAEFEHRSHMAELAAKRSHEAKLAALNSDRNKARLKLTLALGGGLVVAAALGGLAAWRGGEQERLAREQAILAEQRRTAAELARLEVDFESAQKNGEVLSGHLARAREALDKKVETPLVGRTGKGALRGQAPGPRVNGRAQSKRETAEACKCLPDDPICACL